MLLASCFASKAPLISETTADLPFANDSKFSEFTNCEASSASLLGCKGYKLGGTGSLRLAKGRYTLEADPGDDDSAIVAAQTGAQASPELLFKKFSKELYIVQLEGSSQPAGADFNYALLRLSGNVAYLYILNCEQTGDARYVKKGMLSRIENTFGLPVCQADNLTKLGAIFRDRLGAGVLPDRKFQFASS